MRGKPPTGKQLEFAKKLGMTELPDVDRYSLSAFLDMAIAVRTAAQQESQKQFDEYLSDGFGAAHATDKQLIRELCSRRKPTFIVQLENYDFATDGTEIACKLTMDGNIFDSDMTQYILKLIDHAWSSKFDVAEFTENQLDGMMPPFRLTVGDIEDE
jgi:hypothetical protein